MHERIITSGSPAGVPLLSADGAIFIDPNPDESKEPIDLASPVIAGLNSIFDLGQFKLARRPFSLGRLSVVEAELLVADRQVPKITDLPIKFPGSNIRLPGVYAQFAPTVRRIANFERRVNPRCYDEYYCYLTVQQGWVKAGLRQRPSPCHVDGFQGRRVRPKVRCNHSYVVSNAVPTIYHVQPFDLDHLDEARHNFFWEMNRQVELVNGVNAWTPSNNEIVLMDCYCVHRGGVALVDVFRTFVRISFEVRIFDHIDNGHNPLFAYDWPLVDRHIEKLGLSIWQPGDEERSSS